MNRTLVSRILRLSVPVLLALSAGLRARAGEAELKPDAYLRRAEAKAGIGDFDGAISDFGKVIALDPGNEDAFLGRAGVRMNKEDFEGAAADFRKVIELDPGNAGALLGRGHARANTDDFDGAIADFSEAIALAPGFGMAYGGRGLVRGYKQDFDGALDDLDKAVAFTPWDIQSVAMRGTIKAHRQDFDGALADLDEAVSLEPSNAFTLLDRGLIKDAKGDFPGALTDFRNAVQESAESPYPHFFLFLALRRAHADERPAGLPGVMTIWKDEWPKAIGRFFTGGLSESELFSLAKAVPASLARRQQCEAFYYAGMVRLLRGDKTGAKECLENCLSTNVVQFVEYSMAEVEMARLNGSAKAPITLPRL